MANGIRPEKYKPTLNPRKLFDFPLGYALLWDKRVPLYSKIGAVTIGIAIVALLEFLELPFEEILLFVLPLVGIAADVLLDTAEAIIGPVVIASLLLPYLTPSALVEQIRYERDPHPPEPPIIDI